MLKSCIKLFIFLNFISCSTSSLVYNTALPPYTPWGKLTNPRYIEGELIVSIKDIRVLSGDELKNDNLSKNIPDYQKPTLLLWSAQINSSTNQRNVKNLLTLPEPYDIFTEENGNIIQFWDLSNNLATHKSIAIRRRFSYLAYDYKAHLKIDSSVVSIDSIPKGILTFYTKEESFLPQTKAITSLGKQITKGIKFPVLQAKAIHEWVNKNMTYVYPPKQRGAENAIQTMQGDCGQYSNLFIALSRSIGIPAQQQSGFNFSSQKISYHVWSEIYLAGIGWIPVDATRKNGFGYLDNGRLIASVGMNIPLKHVPEWATYQNSDVQKGRTDFMQLVTIVKSGFEADISSELHVLHDKLLIIK